MLVGNGLAALPFTGNDLCSAGASSRPLVGEGEGVLSQTTVDAWPLRTSCAYDLSGGDGAPIEREVFGPSTAVWLLWLALGAVAAVLVGRHRASAAVRGAAAAAVLLAAFGWLQHDLGEYPAAFFGLAFVPGPVLTAAVDVVLRPRPQPRSLVVGLVLPLPVLVAWTVPAFTDLATLGTILGIATGALVAAGVEWVGARARPPLAEAPG